MLDIACQLVVVLAMSDFSKRTVSCQLIHPNTKCQLAGGNPAPLNLDERPSRQELAAGVRVTERTIYRDLNRLGSIVEQLPDGRYQRAERIPGKLKPKDLQIPSPSWPGRNSCSGCQPAVSERFCSIPCVRAVFWCMVINAERFKPYDKV